MELARWNLMMWKCDTNVLETGYALDDKLNDVFGLPARYELNKG